MISSNFVLICNRFHARLFDSGKILISLTFSFERISLPCGTQFFDKKTRVFVAATVKIKFVILVFTVLIELQGMTDTYTDGQTPLR